MIKREKRANHRESHDEGKNVTENEEAEQVLDEGKKRLRVHVVGGGGGEDAAVDDPVAVPLGEKG